MRQAYLDCSSGISGDMFLAALLDAGLSLDRLWAELEKVPLGDYEFKRTRVLRGGLVGTHVDIVIPGKQPHRHLRHIEAMLDSSQLSPSVKERAHRIFSRIAEVEGKLHGKSPQEVHFHEVGAVDAIVDIVGVCAGLELLEIANLICSPLNVGGGRVEAAHGSLPVPAPATAELLKNVPIYSTGVEAELVTPTGAALVTTLASSFGPMPAMRIAQIGYGAGTKEVPGHPNLARLCIGECAESVKGQPWTDEDEVVSVIEANVDDMSPQLYGYFLDRALEAGALDVWCSSVVMKKNRPGLLISVLCPWEKRDALTQLFFKETTTIGVRIHETRRKVLERESESVETEFGPVRVKVARRNGRVLNATPEFEDCQRLAREKSVPLKQVMQAAQAAYRARSQVSGARAITDGEQ
jgi:uncharacterized protein (TIGR00299 family) protein